MRARYKREDYQFMRARRMRAFQDIAAKLGKNHPITKMMGSRAWGRHSFEEGVDGNLASSITEYASLCGAFDVLNTWARDNDSKAQQVMLALWPHSMHRTPHP